MSGKGYYRLDPSLTSAYNKAKTNTVWKQSPWTLWYKTCTRTVKLSQQPGLVLCKQKYLCYTEQNIGTDFIPRQLPNLSTDNSGSGTHYQMADDNHSYMRDINLLFVHHFQTNLEIIIWHIIVTKMFSSFHTYKYIEDIQIFC